MGRTVDVSTTGNRCGRMHPQLILVLAVLGGCAWGFLSLFKESKPAPSQPFASPYKNTRPEAVYVGDGACARCHSEISESFSRHPMGRSMTTPDKVKPEASGKVFEVDGLSYWIERRDGRVFHQERKVDPDGKTVATTEHEVAYVMGSGTRGFAFLIEREDGLYQSPIAWYTEREMWDLAPGYRTENLHFDRKILSDCLFCHANRFEEVQGKPVEFHGLSIGCERCHGPGSLHVRNPDSVDGRNLSIVNPAVLEPASVREAVCEQCHFQGFRREERFAGASAEYRPGLPLDDYLLVVPERFGLTKKIQAVKHVDQMHRSRCYKDGGERLGCISCHDPHNLPEPAERVAYYQKKCLECHAERGCVFPAAERLRDSPENDCVSCHMPRLQLDNIAHTAATDHAIPRNVK